MRNLILLIVLALSSQAMAGRRLDCQVARMKCEKQKDVACKRKYHMCMRKEESLSCYEIYHKRSERYNRALDFGFLGLELSVFVVSAPFGLTLSAGSYLAAAFMPKQGARATNYPARLSNKIRHKGQGDYREYEIFKLMKEGFGFGPGQFCENYPRLASVREIKRYTKERVSEEYGIEFRHGRVVNVHRRARIQKRQELREYKRKWRRDANSDQR